MEAEKLQITSGSDNVFRDLGFLEGEAANLGYSVQVKFKKLT